MRASMMQKQFDKERKEMTMTLRTADRLLSAEDLATMLSLSRRQVFRLNSCGRIPAPVRIGGAVRWRLDNDIKPWIGMGCPDRKEFETRRQAENAN